MVHTDIHYMYKHLVMAYKYGEKAFLTLIIVVCSRPHTIYRSGGGTEIRLGGRGGGGGGLTREAAKQPIISVKLLGVKVKNWGGGELKPL